MKNRILHTGAGVLLALVLCLGMWQTAAAQSISLQIDGAATAVACEVSSVGTVSVPIRAASNAILQNGCTVSWNAGGGYASVRTSNVAVTAAPGDRYIAANGRYLGSDSGVYAKNGSVFVPVRTLGRALGATVDWNGATGTVTLRRGSGAIVSGSSFYNADDLYWLSRIISAESRGEPMPGQIAVGNVVQNRVRSSEFPGSIYTVIFDTKWGVQFTPVANNTIYNEPAASSVIAAKICLDGYTLSDRVLYFMEPATSANPWAASRRPYAFSIGSHAFYE